MKKQGSIVIGRLQDLPPTPNYSTKYYSNPEVGVETVKEFDRLVELPVKDGLLDAEELVGCSMAIPHDDRHITGTMNKKIYFLNLVVASDHHAIGDVRAPYSDQRPLREGDVFVIDPDIYHWLNPSYNLLLDHEIGHFVVRQWTCTKRGLGNVLARLAYNWGFDPYDGIDGRYAELVAAVGRVTVPPKSQVA